MHPDEMPTSYVSRLAQLHRTQLRFFCLDMGFTRQSIADGNGDTLAKIANLTGTPLGLLCNNTLTRDGAKSRVYYFRDERLIRHFLRRQAAYFCPACLRDDIAATSLEPATAAYSRIAWQFDSIRACPIHQIELVEPAFEKGAFSSDFATIISPYLPRLDDLVESATARPATALELYLINRLEHRRAGKHWLDTFDIHVAAKLVEVIGSVALYGSQAKTKHFDGQQWSQCGAAGFEHASNLGTFLRFIRRVHEANRLRFAANAMPQATLGQLYKWVYGQRDPSFDAVKEIIVNFAKTTFPLSQGQNILGHQISERTLHSVHSASLEYGIHPKTLRKILTAMGVVPDAPSLTNHHLTFDAGVHAPLLRKIATSKCAHELEAYLGASRVHAKVLIDHEFVVPFTGRRSPDSSLGEHLFAQKDLDQFMRRFLERAEPVETTPENAYLIADAAKRANCSAAEIFRLVLDKKLKWTGKLNHVHGISSLLVDLDEIKTFVHGSVQDGFLTGRDVAAFLQINEPSAIALITAGILPHKIVSNPVNRCHLRVVPQFEVERFAARYIHLKHLAQLAGIGSKKIVKMLERAGIEPAFGTDLLRAKVYDRVAATLEVLGH